MPPRIQADFRGAGRGTLFGNWDISNAIVDGIFCILSIMPFFRTTLFLGDPEFGVPFGTIDRRFLANGDGYGGGFRALAASQSNGVEADRDGLVTGEMG